MAYSWQYGDTTDDFPESARGALNPRRNRKKTSGALQRVPTGLQRIPGTGWEGADQFAQDMAQSTDLAMGVAEQKMAQYEGRDQYGSTLSSREPTVHDRWSEGLREREASYTPGRSRNLQDLERLGERARAMGQQGLTVMGPPGWLALGGVADAGLKTLGGVLKEEGKAAIGMPAGEGGRGNWGAFGQHYEEAMDTPMGRWSSEMLEESDQRMADAGFSLSERVMTDMVWPLGPIRIGRAGRMARELIGMGGLSDDVAVAGRGSVRTSRGGLTVPGSTPTRISREQAEYRAREQARLANEELGYESDWSITTTPDQAARMPQSGFDQGAHARAQVSETRERGDILQRQGTLLEEANVAEGSGNLSLARGLRAEAERLEDRERFNYQRDSHGIGTRAQELGPVRGIPQDADEVAFARDWQDSLRDLRRAAEEDDVEFALDILEQMDETEHGSNVAFEARSMAEEFREQGNGRAAATLEQAADDYADRVPESIREQYTEDAWRANTTWRPSGMTNQLLPPDVRGARATIEDPAAYDEAWVRLRDEMSDSPGPPPEIARDEQRWLERLHDQNEESPEAYQSLLTRLIHDAARPEPNLERLELLAQQVASAGANGNERFVFQEALELAGTRTDQAGEWASDVFRGRLGLSDETPDRNRLPANLEDDTTFEQMHREYLEANRGVDETQFDAQQSNDLNEVQERIDQHLDHLDFDEAYALARQYEFDINFQGQTSPRGIHPPGSNPEVAAEAARLRAHYAGSEHGALSPAQVEQNRALARARARHTVVDGQEDIEDSIVQLWEQGEDGAADDLAARHNYDIDADGNLSHPRVEYASAEEAQARYRERQGVGHYTVGELDEIAERGGPGEAPRLQAETVGEARARLGEPAPDSPLTSVADADGVMRRVGQQHGWHVDPNGVAVRTSDNVEAVDELADPWEVAPIADEVSDLMEAGADDEARALAESHGYLISPDGQSLLRQEVNWDAVSGSTDEFVDLLTDLESRTRGGTVPLTTEDTLRLAREAEDLYNGGASDSGDNLLEAAGYDWAEDGGIFHRGNRRGDLDRGGFGDRTPEPAEMTEREMRNAQAEDLLRFFERAREEGDDELANKLLPFLVAAGASEDDEGGAMAMAGGLVRPGRGRLFRTGGLTGVPSYGTQARVARSTGRTVPEAQRLAQESADAQAESRLPKARENIEKAIPEGQAWFNLSPLREGMVDELGDAIGGDRFKGVAARLGPTSSGSTVPEEVARTLWAQHGANAGIPIGELEAIGSGPQPWKPMGHTRYYKGMLPGLERIENLERTGGNVMEAMDPTGQFKTRRMSEAAYGNYQNVPPDMHMGRQFHDTSKPDPYQRRSIEKMHQEILGPEYGLDPTPTMAAQWVGGAEETGIRDPRGLMDIFNDEIGKAAQRMGLSDSEFFGRWARGELPAGSVRMPAIPDWKEYVVDAAHPKAFAQQLELARQGKYGGFLSPATEGSLIDEMAATFLSGDQKAGYAITRSGDVRHVFNMSRRKGTGEMMLSHAKVQGAKSLDAFDGFLTKLYRKNGFVETGRDGWNDEYMPDNWNLERDGRPDVVEMEYTGPKGDAAEAAIRKRRKKKRGGLK